MVLLHDKGSQSIQPEHIVRRRLIPADWLTALWCVLGRGMISIGVMMASEIVLFSVSWPFSAQFLSVRGQFGTIGRLCMLWIIIDPWLLYKKSIWWKVSRICCKSWWFYGEMQILWGGWWPFSLSPCPGAGAATKWRNSKTSTARGYQKSPNSISNLIICRRNVLGCDGASKGCQRARNLVPQSKNRGQIFSNWNHYVRLLGERPDCLSLLFKLCVVGRSDGEFCGILAKTCPFRVAVVFRGVGDGSWSAASEANGVAPKRRGVIATAREVDQKEVLGILDQSLCPRMVLCAGMKSYRDEMIQKSDHFIANLGGRRPPRRVRAYNSTNNHEFKTTRILLPQGIYGMERYG